MSQSNIPGAAGVVYDDVLEIIRQMHPDVSILAAMGAATDYSIKDYSGIYKIRGEYNKDAATHSTTSTTYVVKSTKTITDDITGISLSGEVRNTDGTKTGYFGYTINSDVAGEVITIGSKLGTFWNRVDLDISDLSTNDVVRFWLKSNSGADAAELKNCIIYSADAGTSGSIISAAISANTNVLSFFSHLKGKFSIGASSHANPVQVEIYGNGDAYAAALNATTKFKIDVADPIIELYRADDSEVAKSNDQTDWTLDDNVTNGAFPSKTTSTHETILAEEIGCASIVLVEKSVNGAFNDTETLIEDDDYTVDYSTRTATKIILTSAEAADIVISQSKLRITWIADVEDIEGTANTALKMKIYLNRTSTGEASPEIQKIDLGTDKYAEMQYLCG